MVFKQERGNAGFFWSRFHAPFYNTLKINAPRNEAWPRPAKLRKRLQGYPVDVRGITRDARAEAST